MNDEAYLLSCSIPYYNFRDSGTTCQLACSVFPQLWSQLLHPRFLKCLWCPLFSHVLSFTDLLRKSPPSPAYTTNSGTLSFWTVFEPLWAFLVLVSVSWLTKRFGIIPLLAQALPAFGQQYTCRLVVCFNFRMPGT